MIDSVAAQWALTAVFVVVAAFYLDGLARRDVRRAIEPAVDDGLHVLMAVGMIAMLWPWGMAVPVIVYVVIFTASALWFVSRALFVSSPVLVGARDTAAAGHHGGRGFAWYHAGMMASMVFMAVAMSVGMSTLPLLSGTSAASGMAMAGMDMGSGDSSATAAPGMAAGMQAVPWVGVLSLVLAAGSVMAAVWLVVTGFRDGRRPAVLAGAVGGLMAAGMAAVFVQMA